MPRCGVVAGDLVKPAVDHRRTPGTVSDVSAILVARMTRRSCAGPHARRPARRRRASRAAERSRRRGAPRRASSSPLRARDLAAHREGNRGSGRRARQHRLHRARPATRRRAYSIDDRMQLARAPSTTGQSPRNARHARGVERRRHDDDAQVVAREPGLPRQCEAEVGVDAALVELVEDDRSRSRRAADPAADARSGCLR